MAWEFVVVTYTNMTGYNSDVASVDEPGQKQTKNNSLVIMPWYGAEQSFGLVYKKDACTFDQPALHSLSAECIMFFLLLVLQALSNPHKCNLSTCVFQDIVSLRFLYIKYKAQ